jgi:hypothetical protein
MEKTMNLALINPKVWAELAVAAMIAGLCWWAYNAIYDRGADHVQRKWDAVELEQSQQSTKIATDALKVTTDIQASADKRQGDSNAQIATLNKSLGTAIAGLSNRPARPGDGSLPASAGTGRGCTGADLYRPDAEFLTRETARAEKLRIKLASCEADYAEVAAKLNGKPAP